jgi:hypothetical protein
MNKKYKVIGIILIFLISSVILFFLINVRGTEKISVNNVELLYRSGQENKKGGIPKNATIIKEINSKKKEYGMVYLYENAGNTEIYILFGYPFNSGGTEFTSIIKKDKKIIIKTNKEESGGLTEGSTFVYKIKIQGKVDEVILKEKNK